MPRIFDITLPYAPEYPAWPGEPKPVVERMRSLAAGDSANVTRLAAGMHFGTHVDAPVHFIAGAGGVETLPLDALIGPAVVVDVGEAKVITPAVLESAALPAGTARVLFRSTNSRLWADPGHAFRQDYVALTPAAARWLVDRGIRLVGVDYLSVEPYGEPGHATHHVLLAAGVVIVEGLDLRAVSPGIYQLVCLPLKLVGSDGAPARVVLIEPEAA